MTHAFIPDPTSLQGDCLTCGMNWPHLSPESPEPYTPPDFMPLLPEDTVEFWNVPCPLCRVKSGQCVSRGGHYRTAHRERLEKAQLRAAS